MVLLAVSGGIDSMYMANKALARGQGFAVAHCNFSLRGEESDGDEEFVREWCGRHGITCHVIRFDTSTYAAEHGISIEMAARELRYSWFAQLCRQEGYEAVAVAHNANDNAETLMLNLLRGTGSRGMRGMSSDSPLHSDNGIRLLRPVLGTSREEIREWMTSHGYSWREDSTNAGDDARRNVIRNRVFPIFAGLNPSFLRTLTRDMNHFRMADDIAEDYYSKSLPSLVTEDGGIDLGALLPMKHWEYLLYRLLEDCNLSEETFGKLVDLLKSGRTISGKTFESPTSIVRIRKKILRKLPR